jgi:hypothetical protein
MVGLKAPRIGGGALSELLRAAGLLTDHRRARRTLTPSSIFYIGQQLIAGVNVFAPAKDTGTAFVGSVAASSAS